MNKFSEFANEKPLIGNKISIKEIENKPIFIIGYRLFPSKYDSEECMALQLEFEGNQRVLFTGSKVLIDQMKKYNDKLPFEATVIRPDNKYYTFS